MEGPGSHAGIECTVGTGGLDGIKNGLPAGLRDMAVVFFLFIDLTQLPEELERISILSSSFDKWDDILAGSHYAPRRHQNLNEEVSKVPYLVNGMARGRSEVVFARGLDTKAQYCPEDLENQDDCWSPAASRSPPGAT